MANLMRGNASDAAAVEDLEASLGGSHVLLFDTQTFELFRALGLRNTSPMAMRFTAPMSDLISEDLANAGDPKLRCNATFRGDGMRGIQHPEGCIYLSYNCESSVEPAQILAGEMTFVNTSATQPKAKSADKEATMEKESTMPAKLYFMPGENSALKLGVAYQEGITCLTNGMGSCSAAVTSLSALVPVDQLFSRDEQVAARNVNRTPIESALGLFELGCYVDCMTLEPPGIFLDLSAVLEKQSSELKASGYANDHWIVTTCEVTNKRATVRTDIAVVNEIKFITLLADKARIFIAFTIIKLRRRGCVNHIAHSLFSYLFWHNTVTEEEGGLTAQHNEDPKLAELRLMKAARDGFAETETPLDLLDEAAKDKPVLSVNLLERGFKQGVFKSPTLHDDGAVIFRALFVACLGYFFALAYLFEQLFKEKSQLKRRRYKAKIRKNEPAVNTQVNRPAWPRSSRALFFIMPTILPMCLSMDTSVLRTAVGAWCSNPVTAAATYGDISGWDTGDVDDMSYLFNSKHEYVYWPVYCFASGFNDDISAWNTAKVTSMGAMFIYAGAFNQDISAWDTAKVTSMYAMFSHADAFNQDLSPWNTSEVTSLDSTFGCASAFNQDISPWNIAKVTSFYSTFYSPPSCGGGVFNQVLCWDLAGNYDFMTFDNSDGSANPSAPKCACAAGTFYDGGACSPCPSGTLSYGKTASCITCPSGKVPSADQTACLLPEPTSEPTLEPTNPTPEPAPYPTPEPILEPMLSPTLAPTPVPTLVPTPGPIPGPTPHPTAFPTASDTVAIAVSFVMTTAHSTVSDAQKATLKTSVAFASGVDEADIDDFSVVATPARRRLTSYDMPQRRLASYTWTVNCKVVSSLSSVGQPSAISYSAAITSSLQANLAAAVSANMGIAVIVTRITTTDASRNSAHKTQPSAAPTTTKTKSADEGLAGMLMLIILLVVALVTCSCTCVFVYYRRASFSARSAINDQPTQPSAESLARSPQLLTHDEILSKLERLSELHQKGLVTEQTFKKKFKKELAYLNELFEAVPDAAPHTIDL